MMANIRRMFFGGNTANGFRSFHDNIIGLNRNRLFILKGMPGGGKSSLMRKIAEDMLKEGFNIEYHHCPSDAESIDSIFIKELNIAIADGTAPHVIDPIYPGLTDKLIDLAQFIDIKKLANSKDKIVSAKENNKKAYGKAFAYFKAAKIIYDEIVENNKRGMDFGKLNKRTISLIDEIFSKEIENREKFLFKERHLFSNANTPSGYVDYTNTILEKIPNIYYVEGEMGTGKSTLIKRIMEEGKIRDYSMEIYHNSTIPEKIESLIIKDLNLCITSNRYGLEFPHKKIDLNQYFNEKVINSKDYQIYNLLIEEATLNLSDAKKNHEVLENSYKPSVDYNGVNRVKGEILEEIMNYIS